MQAHEELRAKEELESVKQELAEAIEKKTQESSKDIQQKEDWMDFKIVWLIFVESKQSIVMFTMALTILTAMVIYYSPIYISSMMILRSLLIGVLLSIIVVLIKARNKVL